MENYNLNKKRIPDMVSFDLYIEGFVRIFYILGIAGPFENLLNSIVIIFS